MRQKVLRILLLELLLVFAFPADAQIVPVAGDPLKGAGNVSRTALAAAELFSTLKPSSPMNDGAFALPADAAMPLHVFEGRLELVQPESNSTFEMLRDDFKYLSTSQADWKHLPPFRFEFVQNGSHLIPVKHGLGITGHSAWNYIVGPGRVWTEKTDNGYSRVSFPFTLVERNQNCTHNGVMTFLFTNSSRRNISNVRYQITQETCLYFKFNLWGQVPATYTPYAVKNRKAIKNDHAAEVASRVPTRMFSDLVRDHPSSGIDLEGFTKAFRAPEHITLYGVLVNGVHYVSKCPTRFGEYPFCENLRLPSYSTAKSSFASVVMMRLGALYGPGVYRELIRSYVPEHVKGGEWTNVTFDNTLDMATGNFISPDYLADENGDMEGDFLTDEPYAMKIADAFAHFPHKAAPGTTWVYQSHATFIVTQAMDGYLQRKRGVDPDIFRLLTDDVFKPLKLSRGSLTSLRTDNTSQVTKDSGKAFGSHGLFYISDDVAKLAKFLNNDGGRVNDIQVLDSARLRESLFRDPDSLGLPTARGSVPWAGTYRYNNAFWGKKMTREEFPQDYRCDFWVARMGGYGGISIALMPNGITYYVFSDNNEFLWYDAVREVNKIAPFCKEKESTNSRE